MILSELVSFFSMSDIIIVKKGEAKSGKISEKILQNGDVATKRELTEVNSAVKEEETNNGHISNQSSQGNAQWESFNMSEKAIMK